MANEDGCPTDDRVLSTVYVCIGNSDDKLPQKEWSDFCHRVDGAIRARAVGTYGAWLSSGDSPWQNACWCFVIASGEWEEERLRWKLRELAFEYSQDSISWAVARTSLLTPLGGS